MSTAELLWTIQEERRREASMMALERQTRASADRAAPVLGRLVGWVRGRLRVFRRPTPGWTSS